MGKKGIFLLLFVCCLTNLWAAEFTNLDKLLQTLDSHISSRYAYFNNRVSRTLIIKELINNQATTDEQKYTLYRQLIDEFYPYNFDSTLFYINKTLNIATALNDRNKIVETSINQAYTYSTSGNYVEAWNMVINIDSKSLPKDLRMQFNKVVYKLSKELVNYTQDERFIKYATSLTDSLRRVFLKESPENSLLWREIMYDIHLDKGDLDSAEEICMQLIKQVGYESHDYAKYAYCLSLVKERKADIVGQMEWLAKSAIVDCKLGVRDYASLATLSTKLFNSGDVARAFKYITISLDDAIFYNSKLRTRQVASLLPAIEKGYLAIVEAEHKNLRVVILLIVALFLVVIGGAIILVVHYEKLKKARREMQVLTERAVEYNADLERMNTKLVKLNKEVAEANLVKEQYIGLFLTILSEGIDKLKEYENNVKKKLRYDKIEELKSDLLKSNMVEKELEMFYSLFDKAFLSLYPTFVEDFNALLEPQAKIEIDNNELSTELRIFALIRLGITDSSRIASLLRYSVNTIYNYRAKIKNYSIIDREEFEEKIRSIGSFGN